MSKKASTATAPSTAELATKIEETQAHAAQVDSQIGETIQKFTAPNGKSYTKAESRGMAKQCPNPKCAVFNANIAKECVLCGTPIPSKGTKKLPSHGRKYAIQEKLDITTINAFVAEVGDGDIEKAKKVLEFLLKLDPRTMAEQISKMEQALEILGNDDEPMDKLEALSKIL